MLVKGPPTYTVLPLTARVYTPAFGFGFQELRVPSARMWAMPDRGVRTALR